MSRWIPPLAGVAIIASLLLYLSLPATAAEPRERGGGRCYIVAFQANSPSGEEWFLKEYLIPRGDKVVVLQCGAQMAERQVHEPVFDSIVESLEFTR